MQTTQFTTLYGQYVQPGFLKLKDGTLQNIVFYGIQNDRQYIDKYIFVGGTMRDGVLLVQEVVI